MEKKKILRIISTLDDKMGGTSRIAIDQSNELAKRGYEIDLLTLDCNKNIKNTKKNLFGLINLGINKKKNIFNITFFKWLLKNKKKYNIFLIDGLWEFNTLAAYFLIKKKYIVFLHGQLDPYFATELFKKIKKKFYWSLIERNNLINSKFVILSGNAEKKMISKTFVNTKKIPFREIRYGIQDYKFKNISKLKQKINKKFNNILNKDYILFIGRIHPKKGCDILLSSLDKINVPNNYYFVFVGFSYDTKYEEKILLKIKSSKYSKRIITLPFQDRENKFAFIKYSKSTILPSNGENFGISVVESLMMGKIPILTDKVGVSKIIKKNNAGIICKNNPNSIASAIDNFFSLKKNIINNYEKNALKCFTNNFSTSTTINDLEKLL